LRDPQAHKFVESTIQSDHDTWLDVAHYVAARVCSNSISKELSPSVSSFMAIEFWFDDVAIECRAAQKNHTQNIVLSSLVHHFFKQDGHLLIPI
jgi:hypothetical protein